MLIFIDWVNNRSFFILFYLFIFLFHFSIHFTLAIFQCRHFMCTMAMRIAFAVKGTESTATLLRFHANLNNNWVS
jgi:hypothetical protein